MIFRDSPGGTAADSHDHYSSSNHKLFCALRTKVNTLGSKYGGVGGADTTIFFLANLKCRQPEYLEHTADPRFSRLSPILCWTA